MHTDPPEPLGRTIYQTAQRIKNFAEKMLKPYELTLEQFHLLKHMQQDAGMSQRELGELVNKTPANITRILDRLEAKNLVHRRPSKTDRRATHVFLTQDGDMLKRKVFATFEPLSAQLTEGISDKRQDETRKILATITKNIQIMSQHFQS